MFRPEDVKRILEALAKDNKIQQMKKELDDMENGDDVDNSEEARRPPTRTRQRERILPGRPESREKRI